MEENSKKIPFFTRVKWAIFNLENYDFFAVENTKVAIFYFLKLMLIFSLIIAIGVTYKFATTDLKEIPELQEVVTEELIESIQSMPKIELYVAFYIISAIYLYLIYFIVTITDVILLFILGLITSRIAKVILKYAPIVNIAIYSLTLSIFLNAIYILVNLITGFEIKYFQLMYNAVAYIYMVTAILMLKSEMIKQETQIAKIEEEQKRVKEELERQEEEERQKQEQKRKEREEQKKDNEKKERKKEENEGGAYEGQT